MGFASLLGNEGLKEQLHNAFARGRAAHFYLISGPEGSGKGRLARLLAAAFLCESREKPCLRCESCRKALEQVHPDVIWVTDPEHKNVPVKQIRQVRDDLFIRPNEGSHKIYILPQPLGIEGQNALLKVLEEPPQYGVFLLLTDNPETVLPTVRSRCVELKLLPLPASVLLPALQTQFPQAEKQALQAAMERSGGYFGQAKALLSAEEKPEPYTLALVDALSRRDPLLLTQTLAKMEQLTREALLELLAQWTVLLEGALLCRAGLPAPSEAASRLAAARSARELNDAIRLLQQASEYANSNVSPGAICGWLAHVL